MDKSDPLKNWQGSFGEKYLERNQIEDWKIKNAVEAFRRMLADIQPTSILEVGSNIGINLAALSQLGQGAYDLYAVEPFEDAFQALSNNQQINLKQAFNTNAYSIPLEDNSIDLVFTCGVLIHIPTSRLEEATNEIYRVSKKYILCAEYFSHDPVELPYHSQEGMLFKRDFGAFYLEKFNKLKTLNYGFLWQKEFENYDNLNWWLFEKVSV